jgi:hypothetical protein
MQELLCGSWACLDSLDTETECWFGPDLRVIKKTAPRGRSRESGSREWLTRGHEDTQKAGAWVLKPGFMPIRYGGVLGRSQP